MDDLFACAGLTASLYDLPSNEYARPTPNDASLSLRYYRFDLESCACQQFLRTWAWRLGYAFVPGDFRPYLPPVHLAHPNNDMCHQTKCLV